MKRFAFAMILTAAALGCGSARSVRVLTWSRDLDAGQEINAADVAEAKTSGAALREAAGVVAPGGRGDLLRPGTTVARDVREGALVRYGDVVHSAQEAPSADISPGMVALTLPVDTDRTPGPELRLGDRVDVIGLVGEGRWAKPYTLVENLRVLAVSGPGGRGRSVTVEASPEVASQLSEVLPRLSRPAWLAARRSGRTETKFGGKLNPEVLRLLKPGGAAGN